MGLLVAIVSSLFLMVAWVFENVAFAFNLVSVVAKQMAKIVKGEDGNGERER